MNQLEHIRNRQVEWHISNIAAKCGEIFRNIFDRFSAVKKKLIGKDPKFLKKLDLFRFFLGSYRDDFRFSFLCP